MNASRPSIGIAVILCGLAWPTPLRADSDGYFCTGPGYLAFQLRSWHTDGPHLLKIIRFGEGEIREAGELELPDFQPHAIRCETERVRIVGWALHYVEFSIDVSGEPRLLETIEDPELEFSPALFETPMMNLGELAVPGSIPLSSEDPLHRYRLAIERRSSPVTGGLEHYTRTVLIAETRTGTPVGELLVYEGTRFESIH